MTCHVFVVDIIMFIKRFVVFSSLHFCMNFYCVCREWTPCWVMVGATLCDGWCNVGLWLMQCWVMVGTMLGHDWCNGG